MNARLEELLWRITDGKMSRSENHELCDLVLGGTEALRKELKELQDERVIQLEYEEELNAKIETLEGELEGQKQVVSGQYGEIKLLREERDTERVALLDARREIEALREGFAAAINEMSEIGDAIELAAREVMCMWWEAARQRLIAARSVK